MSETSDFQTLLARLTSEAPQEKPSTNTQSKNERSQSLLNLLKFSNPTAPPSANPKLGVMGNEQSAEHAAAAGSNAPMFSPTSIHKGKNESNISDQKSQDALLKLLQRSVSSSSQPKPVEAKVPDQAPFAFSAKSASNTAPPHKISVEPPPAPEHIERNSSPVRMFGTSASREPTPFDPPTVAAGKDSKPNFAFLNPFDMLQAARSVGSQPVIPRSSSPQIFTSVEPPANADNADKSKTNELSESQPPHRRKLMPKIPGRNGRHGTPELKKELEPSTQTSHTLAGPTKKESGSKIKQEDYDIAADLVMIAEKLRQASIDSAVVDTTKQATGKAEDGVEAWKASGAGPPSNAEVAKDKGEASDDDALPAQDESLFEHPAQESTRKIPVYNFPLKPFVAITIEDLPASEVELGEVIEVSRFKKDFDQADRSLVSASSNYIAYGFVKHGGFRLIRQDDGMGVQVFKESGDRVFHVAVCTTSAVGPASEYQSVVAAGLSGAIYYATISKIGRDFFTTEDIRNECLIFPPTPLGDANTSDGAVKSRVRRSSRHPEFFGLGRGSTIRIIWPATAFSAKYGVNDEDRVVDTEKFYRDRNLKITCPRAQKDFVFSEDDTVIASLDKNGKLSFWDIEKLTEKENATATKVRAQDITTPIMTLATAPPGSKGTPTSVLFADKLRAYSKGVAQRYIIVGYKQNHILQLWDLVLKKVVQEIHLPQEADNDGLCSVAYHPETGMITVGHPTRNSIFFIHLSTPKYDNVGYSQAVFLEQLAKERKAPDLRATACLSGMREISFAQKGLLRSIETVPIPKTEGQKNSPGVTTKFELYVAHSKGVTCLAIKNEDLGWGDDGKELLPVNDGLETGVFKIDELPILDVSDSEQRGLGQQGVPHTKTTKKKGTKTQPETKVDVDTKLQEELWDEICPENSNGVAGASAMGIIASSGKKKKKEKGGSGTAPKVPELAKFSLPSSSPNKSTTKISEPADQLSTPKSTDMVKPKPHLQSSDPVSNGFLAALAGGGWKQTGIGAPPTPEVKTEANADSKVIGNLMSDLEARVLKGMGEHVTQLHRRLEDDRRVSEATGNNRQEAILRLVSSTLSDNVENTLHQIIKQQIEKQVVPTVATTTNQTIRNELSQVVNKSLQTLVPQQIDAHVVAGLTQALQGSGFARSLTDGVLKALQPTLSNEFHKLLEDSVVPKFKDMAVEAALKTTLDMESRFKSQLRRMDLDRAHDNAKLDSIQASLQQVTEMMGKLSHSQVAFQEKLLSDHRTPDDLHRPTADAFHGSAASNTAVRATPQPSRQVSAVLPSPIVAPPFHPSRHGSAVLPSPIGPPSTKAPEQLEIEDIRGMLEQQKFEGAAIKWLQSARAVEVFDEAFLGYSPAFLKTEVSPLVAFSVGVTVANSFDRNIVERLEYVYASLQTLDVRDPEIQSLANHAPQLLNSLLSKLEDLYSGEIEKVGGKIPQGSWLPLLHGVINKAIQVRTSFGEL